MIFDKTGIYGTLLILFREEVNNDCPGAKYNKRSGACRLRIRRVLSCSSGNTCSIARSGSTQVCNSIPGKCYFGASLGNRIYIGYRVKLSNKNYVQRLLVEEPCVTWDSAWAKAVPCVAGSVQGLMVY